MTRTVVERGLWTATFVAMLVWFLDFYGRAEETLIGQQRCLQAGYGWLGCDPMMFTGFLTVILGLVVHVLTGRDEAEVIADWERRGLLDTSQSTLDDPKAGKRGKLAIYAAVIVVLSVMIAIGYASVKGDQWLADEHSLASMVSAVLVGGRLARIVSHGRIGNRLRARGVHLSLHGAHPDGAGGAGPIGRYFLIHTSVIWLPLAYLIVWLWLMPQYPGYQAWQPLFLALVAFGLAILVAGFMVPMLWFKAEIAAWRARVVEPDIQALKSRLTVAGQSGDALARVEESQKILAALQQLTSLSSWPVAKPLWTGFKGVIVSLVLAVATSRLQEALS